MRRLRVVVVFCITLLAGRGVGLASPVTIFSTLSTGHAYTYNNGTALDLDPIAFAFTPTAGFTYDLTRLDVAVTRVNGQSSPSSGVLMELRSDQAGQPGSLLDSWTLSSLPVFGSVSTIQASQQVTGITGLTLLGGTQYWLEALLGQGRTVWNLNGFPSDGHVGDLKADFVSGQWHVGSTADPGGFAVYGEASPLATPEPGAVVLTATGVAWLFWRRRTARA